MTREEAIKHFEAQAQCNYRPFREAAELAVTALRAQQEPVKLDRSRWEGCNACSDVAYLDFFQSKRMIYCPYCGRPLTEEAWAELERRVNDGTTDNYDGKRRGLENG